MSPLCFKVTEHFSSNLPVLLIDFNLLNLVDEEEFQAAFNVWNHLVQNGLKQAIYQTCQTDKALLETSAYPLLPDWTLEEGKPFLEALVARFPERSTIQLCGIYRELCMVSVAHLILQQTTLDPIIIIDDNYSISATYSVAEGETLETRIIECGGILKEV